MKLPIQQRFRLFQKVAAGILILFFGIMFFVTIIAYLRPSGSTGLDMSKIQKMRQEAIQETLSERP